MPQTAVLPEEISREQIAAPVPASVTDLTTSPTRFINRELSWLQFNRRVLEEAQNASHPVLERVRFPVDFSQQSRRIFHGAGLPALKGRYARALPPRGPDGLTPAEQLSRITDAVSVLASDQLKRWQELREELAQKVLSW